MEYGYYPGCSLKSTSREYDLSVRKMCESFGVNLVEIEDWNCCGASPAHAMNEELSLALPLRNLIQAEKQHLKTVLSPCPACHSHMSLSHKESGENIKFQERMKELLKEEYTRSLTLKHVVDFLYRDIGLETVRSKTTKPLAGLKIASYYGCLNRLPGIEIEDKENPVMMDEIVTALGGESVEWSHKVECCGAGFSLTKTSVVHRLVKDLLDAAKIAGANCIAVVCPLCQSNLDMRQIELERKGEGPFALPVVYLSQLVLLAQGRKPDELGFEKHLVSCKSIFSMLP
jgi:heterodisulfide reductase subunit B